MMKNKNANKEKNPNRILIIFHTLMKNYLQKRKMKMKVNKTHCCL
jgi:hypothetical protein